MRRHPLSRISIVSVGALTVALGTLASPAHAQITPTTPPATTPTGPSATPPPPTVIALGTAAALPANTAKTVTPVFDQPIAAIAATPTGNGYWLTTMAGTVFAYGDAAPDLGSLTGLRLNQPIVGMTATATGKGYWLVANDGGIFAFGDAQFYGSTGSIRLNKPIVGMTATATGKGYWLVANDGGIFAFGDAVFAGSTGSLRLNRPIVGMATAPGGAGYWLGASDGGIFAFGDTSFYGSAGDQELASPVVSMTSTASGRGYWMVTAAGEVLAFGPDAAKFPAATAAQVGRRPIVGMATARGAGVWIVGRGEPDLATVFQSRGLRADAMTASLQGALEAGAFAAVTHTGVLGLTSIRRGTSVVQAPPVGMRYPMSTIALDPTAAAATMGPPVAHAIAIGLVVMGETSARLRGARAGDQLDLIGWDGRTRTYTVGFIAPDPWVSSTELVMSTATAAAAAFSRPASVRVWGFRTREELDAAMARRLAPIRSAPIEVTHSWDAPDVDSTLSTAAVKTKFGEFAFAPASGDSVTQEPGWPASQLQVIDLPIIGPLRCHRLIADALVGALNDVQSAGLGGFIDVVDTRRSGGCYNARQIRGGGGTTGGALSRHSWAIAIDINPSTNAFGRAPTLHPGIVEIFRRHGFAWGGTWLQPDGMHFEWNHEVEGPVPDTA